MEQIIYLLVWGALFYFMMRMGGCCGPTGHKHEKGEHERHEHEAKGTVPNLRPSARNSGTVPDIKKDLGPYDPVCGMDVSDRQPLTSQFEGKTYYFCSIVCKNVFEKEPHKYVSGADLKEKETGGCC